jgi:hypothetical protein
MTLCPTYKAIYIELAVYQAAFFVSYDILHNRAYAHKRSPANEQNRCRIPAAATGPSAPEPGKSR